MSRELVNRLEKLTLHAGRKIRICSFPGCINSTVKNHCVSQALITNFDDQGHVRTLVVNPWINGGLIFRRIGVKDVSTFHGLCNRHDHVIFTPVDRSEVNTRSYANKLLLSYRALLHEKLKKTIKKEAYGTFYKEHSLR